MTAVSSPHVLIEFKETFGTVCLGNREAMEILLGEDRLFAEFGGSVRYVNDETGAEYLGVWGKRKASRLRTILRQRGSIIVLEYGKPIGIRMKVRTATGRPSKKRTQA